MLRLDHLFRRIGGMPLQNRRNHLKLEALEERRVMSADLSPTIVQAPETASLDAAFLVNLAVENGGDAESGDYHLQLRLSVDSALDGADRVITTLSRDSIPAGGIDRWQEAIKIPDGVPQGEFFIGVTVDPIDHISEENESNNSAVSSDTAHLLKGLPNLQVCDTFGPMGTAFETGTNCRATEVDGYTRTQIVYVPEGVLESTQPVPMVTMIHGTTGHGLRYYNISGWKEKADEEGLVTVFPTSVNYCEADAPCENGRLSGWTTKWHAHGFINSPGINFDHKPPTYPESASWPAADVDFVNTMWNDLEGSLPIDTNRTYVSGFSNGGGMTRHLLFESPDRMSAVAYAGALGNSGDPDLPSIDPKPMFVALGTTDPKILDLFDLPAHGEIPLAPQEALEIPQLQEYITQTLTLQQLAFDPDNLRPDSIHRDEISTRMTWHTPVEGNEAGNVFHLALWKDLEHQYPYKPDADKNPHGFNATDTFWHFFDSVSNVPDAPAKPDLAPRIIDAPQFGSLESFVQVNVEVENLGQVPSGEFTVQYRLSQDETIDATDRVLMHATRTSIAAGATDSWVEMISIPDSVPQGEFSFGMTVDATHQVVESNETNNSLVSSDTVHLLKGLPNLSQCDTFGPAGTPYETGVNCRATPFENYTRTYIVYVPESLTESAQQVPLVTMFHGSGGSGERYHRISGWRQKADEVGLVAVFPTSAMYCEVGTPCENGRLSGWKSRWNMIGQLRNESINFEITPPGYPDTNEWPANDVGFLDTMWNDIEALLPIDANRMYAAGHSNGGAISRQLLFNNPERLAAVAYTGAFGTSVDSNTPNDEHSSLYVAIGSRDSKMLDLVGLPATGSIPLDPQEILANPYLRAFITQTLHLQGLEFDATNLRPDAIQQDAISTRLTWATPATGNDSGNVFHLSIWKDLTHQYPYNPDRFRNPNEFNATDTFWEFFEQNPNRTTPQVPGDSNGDGVFNSSDLLLAFQAGEYEDGIQGNSTREEGDWNGDGDFDAADIIYVFQLGSYESSATRYLRPSAVDSLFEINERSRNRFASGQIRGVAEQFAFSHEVAIEFSLG